MEDNELHTLTWNDTVSAPSAPACVVVIHGDGFGLRADIQDTPVVIGRSSDATLCIRSPSVSRLHCEIRRDGETYRIRDLGSTNATRIDGRRIEDAVLADGDQITIGESILKFISHTNVEAAYHQRVSRLIYRDQATGLLGRQDFVDAAERQIAESLATGAPLSLMLLDVCEMTQVQLEFGDETVDAVLAHVAAALSRQLGAAGPAARIGECRLAVLLPDHDIGRARASLDTLQRALLEDECPAVSPATLRLLGGAAQLQPGTGSLGQLIKQISMDPIAD